jgi:Integral membrane protein possibly involved in chromosome condensation
MDMEQLWFVALVAIGGAVGSVLRYVISVTLAPYGDISWGTFAVNFIGSFLICFIFFKYGDMSETTRILLFMGFFGAFTTLSSITLEFVNLFSEGQIFNAFLVFLLNTVVCIAAGFIGRAVALL